MTVKELREKLETIPDDREVVMAKDAEGNGFSPLADISPVRYVEANTWSGSVDEGFDEDGKAVINFPFDAVCLWPVN